jgi:hypothetical protein
MAGSIMMMLLLISLLLGMVLGQRFKVLALLPAMAFVLLGVSSAGLAGSQGLWLTVIMAVGAIASLQIGYLAGISIRYFLAAARAGKPRTAFHPGARPVVHGTEPSAL